jgi:hypothetical protein
VQKGHQDEGVCAPVVHDSDESAEQDLILKVKDGLVGLVRERLVRELQKHTRAQKQENQHNRHASQPPREGPAERLFRNIPRSKVKNQAVEESAITLSNFLRSQYAWKNGIENTLKQIGAVRHFVLLRHRMVVGKRLQNCLSIPWKPGAVNEGKNPQFE